MLHFAAVPECRRATRSPVAVNSKATSKKLTPRQARRRERILEATEQLILEHGYAGTTMRAIAERADVTEMTLYNIYGTKAELAAIFFKQRTSDSFDRALAAKPQGGLPFLEQLVREVVASSLALPEVAREGVSIMLTHREIVVSDRLFAHHVGSALKQMADEGLLDRSAVSLGVVRLIGYGFLSSQALWSHQVLSDEELLPYVELQVFQVLSQHATDATVDKYRRRTRQITRKLGPRMLKLPVG